MLGAIRHNLANLTQFAGRDTRAMFWPYAALVIVLLWIAMLAAMLPDMLATMERMLAFAKEHPELATVRSGPGRTSVAIKGFHPELMPGFGRLVIKGVIAFVAAVVLLAAAVTRRLHDRGKSGYWGLVPLPFFAIASLLMPRLVGSPEFDAGLFAILVVNNLVYVASVVFLIALLAGGNAQGRHSSA